MAWNRDRFGGAALGVALALVAAGCGPGDEFRFVGGDGIVRGTILNGLSPSEPEGQVRVSLLGPGTSSSSTATRQDGTFEMRSVTPGLYDLVADKTIDGDDRRVRLRFVEVVEDQFLDLPDLTLDQPGSISGTVLLTGAGPANPVAPDHSGTQVSLIGTTLNTVTDATGAYSLAPVEVGEYQIRFERDEFMAAVISDVDVPPATATTVTTATLERLDPPATGALLGTVALEAAPGGDNSGVTVTLEGTTRTLVTTSGGSWRFDDLPVGSYQVLLTHPDYFESRVTDQQVVSGLPENTVAPLTLSNHKVLSSGLTVTGLAESPSGNQLAYLTSGGNASEVGLLAPDGSAFQSVITQGAEAAADRGLAWHPDESEIFFVQFTGDSVNAFQPAMVPATGGTDNARGLLAPGTDYFLGDFSPRGAGNLYELGFYLTNNLQAVVLDEQAGTDRTELVTATIRPLATSVGQLTELGGFEWGNTGRIVFSREGNALPSDVLTVLASGAFPPVMLAPRRQDPPGDNGMALTGRFQAPTFSPDFSRVAFSIEAGSGGDPEGVYIADIDGENAEQVTAEAARHLDWSNDGTKIYYVRASDGRPAVLKIPARLR